MLYYSLSIPITLNFCTFLDNSEVININSVFKKFNVKTGAFLRNEVVPFKKDLKINNMFLHLRLKFF